MGAEQILTLVTHGGTVSVIALLFWLYVRERNERIAAQALVLTLTKENAESSAKMVRATEENTKATTSLAEGMHQFGDKIKDLIARRRVS
jgi:hypothetical protein